MTMFSLNIKELIPMTLELKKKNDNICKSKAEQVQQMSFLKQ